MANKLLKTLNFGGADTYNLAPDWDNVENRPFYENGYKTENIVPQDVIMVNNDGAWIAADSTGENMYVLQTLPTVGETYTVTWNGVPYECVCTEMEIDPGVFAFVWGNVGLMTGGTDTGEPFVVLSAEEDGAGHMVIAMDTTGALTSLTLAISREFEDIKKLDNKYLNFVPEEYATQTELDTLSKNLVGLKTEGTEYTINNSTVTAETGAEVFNDYTNNKASGAYSHAEGKGTKASNVASHAEGDDTTASGYSSHAEGKDTTASGAFSHAEGDYTTASNTASHAEGYRTTASGEYSHAEGQWTTASGDHSHAEGYETAADSDYQHVQGKYNKYDSANKYAHIVGNGTSASARSNAHTLDWDGNATFAGTVSSSGADYAEYFEWLDGNPNNEDRIGLLVTLDGDKIKLAQSNDEVLGIISGTATVLGDNAEWNWKDRFLKDDFGRIIYEDVEEFDEIVNPETGEVERKSLGFFSHPKINPDYDPSMEYIRRSDRPEWEVVGLMGKLYLRDDGTCEVNQYATAGKDGVATASSEKTNMRVMERVKDDIIRVLLK